MNRRLVLRFRDLITEPGGTIHEHRLIQLAQGEVWWGWWRRQYEAIPRTLFAEIGAQIQKNGPARGYLCNTGTSELYAVTIAEIRVSPVDTGMSSPDLVRSPQYYHSGRYPAWFRLEAIELAEFQRLHLVYDDFPTRPELHGTLTQLQNSRVISLEHLRQIDVTMWVLREML